METPSVFYRVPLKEHVTVKRLQLFSPDVFERISPGEILSRLLSHVISGKQSADGNKYRQEKILIEIF